MANKVTVIAELQDRLTGPNKKLTREYEKSARDMEKANAEVAKASEKAAIAQARSAAKGGHAMAVQAKDVQGASSKIERALDDLSGTTRRTTREWEQSWGRAEKAPKDVADTLATQGRRMETDSRRIGEKVGDNLATGIQSGIDSIDFSDVSALLGGATVGGGIVEALQRDVESRRAAASVSQDPEAMRRLTEAIFEGNFGQDYNSVSNAALSVVGTLELEPGSPEAEALLRGNVTMADVFQLDSERLALAVNIMADVDQVSFTSAQEQIAAALQGAAPGARDEMLDNLVEYAPLLEDTGISAGVLATLLSGASGRGPMASDKTGDLLKEFSIRAVSTGDVAVADAYAAAGLDHAEISRRLQSGDATAFTDVATALAQVEDQAEQAQLAIDIFGTPIEDLGVGNIDDQVAAWSDLELAVSGTGDVLANMEKTVSEGEGAAWSQAWRDLSGAMVDLGDAAAPLISLAAKAISLFAKPIAAGAAGLTLYGILQNIPGTADLGKRALKGLWRVVIMSPLGRAAAITWGLVEGMGALYDNVDWVKRGFDTVSDAIRDVIEWFDVLLGRADEWMAKKLGIENPEDSTIVRDSVSHALGGGPSDAYFENNGLSTDDEYGWPQWLKDIEASANRWAGVGDDAVHGEGVFRMFQGSMPAHANGGWTGAGAHAAIVGEQGREFVVNHWASEKINRAHPGALGEINAGRLPTAATTVPVMVGGDQVHITITDARDPQAVAQQVAAALARRDREKRLTNSTLTARGAR